VRVQNKLNLKEDTVIYEITNKETGKVRQKIMLTGTITNYMDLSDFPFDWDDIVIQIRPLTLTDKDMEFELDEGLAEEERVGFEAAMGMVDWHVGVPSYVNYLQYRASNNTYAPTIDMSIPIVRKFQFYIYRVLLILSLINIMSFFTFSMDTTDFSNRVSINVTLFLAAVAFIFTISSNLPKLPYLTLLDRVLTSSFLFLFGAVVENYIVYLLANSSNENYPNIALIIDHVSLGAFPGLYVVSNAYLYLGMFYRWKKRPEIRFFDEKVLFQGRQSTEERLAHQKLISEQARQGGR